MRKGRGKGEGEGEGEGRNLFVCEQPPLPLQMRPFQVMLSPKKINIYE